MSELSLPVDVGFSTFLWYLFDNELYTDIYFNLEYENSVHTISAHKFVLALKSPYFADEFYGQEKKMNNFISLIDVNPESFTIMLSYMYDNIVPSITTPEMVCDVYKLADRFQVVSVMESCRKCLNSMEIVSSNVFDILTASNCMQNMSKKDHCLKFIQTNTKEVMASYEFSKISPLMIHTFLSLKELSLDSLLDLFKWIFDWAKNRTILDEFLPQLPFSSLSRTEFAKLYSCYADIFEDNEVVSMFIEMTISGSNKMPDWYNKECKMELKSGTNE